MSEQKKLIIDTLDKVDKVELHLFIHNLKIRAFMKLALGEMSKETVDLLIETCNEYLKSLKEQKYIEEKGPIYFLYRAKYQNQPSVMIGKVQLEVYLMAIRDSLK